MEVRSMDILLDIVDYLHLIRPHNTIHIYLICEQLFNSTSPMLDYSKKPCQPAPPIHINNDTQATCLPFGLPASGLLYIQHSELWLLFNSPF